MRHSIPLVVVAAALLTACGAFSTSAPAELRSAHQQTQAMPAAGTRSPAEPAPGQAAPGNSTPRPAHAPRLLPSTSPAVLDRCSAPTTGKAKPMCIPA
jgi:hypothetical protein